MTRAKKIKLLAEYLGINENRSFWFDPYSHEADCFAVLYRCKVETLCNCDGSRSVFVTDACAAVRVRTRARFRAAIVDAAVANVLRERGEE